MRIVATFDPSTETSDTFNAGFAGGSGRIIVYNESNINLQLSWGAFSTYCPAWTAMLYCVSTNDININWQAHSQLVANGAPISQVIVEAYGPTEPITGTFPAALVRQTNIGNSVPLSSSATSVANDGNPANTPVVEATVAGDASSAVLLTAGGTLALGTALNPGSLSSDNGKFKTDGSGNVTSNSHTIASGQKLITPEVDSPAASNLTLNVPVGKSVSIQENGVEKARAGAGGLIIAPGKLGVSADGDVIDAGSPTQTYLKARNAGSINLQTPNGTTIATFDGSSPTIQYTSNNNLSIQESGGGNGCVIGRNAGTQALLICNLNPAGGIGFKQGGQGGTRLAEFKSNGDMIIANGTYWTHIATFAFSASGSYDSGFDIAEMSPINDLYEHGTIVCPHEDGTLHQCEHEGCAFAMIVSLHPAFCAGGGKFDEDEETDLKEQPIALCGRVAVPTSEPIRFKQWVTSDGHGKVRQVKPGEYALGYALADGTDDNRVYLFIRGRDF